MIKNGKAYCDNTEVLLMRNNRNNGINALNLFDLKALNQYRDPGPLNKIWKFLRSWLKDKLTTIV